MNSPATRYHSAPCQSGLWTSTFSTENGVTATDGTAATGTAAAGEITVLKATDMVTFDGGTRGSATIEIEADSNNLDVVMQTVNLEDATTDTVILDTETQ
jgi:hypothetical protein